MLCISTFTKAESLVASVDRNVISIADTFTLQLEAKDLGSLNQPDFSVLEKSFDILSKNVSHNIQNINGVSTQSVVWQLQLQAKQLGDVEIPDFTIEGVSSQKIIIKVKKAVIESADNLDFKLQLSANKEQLKVNEQVLLTLKFFYAKYVNNLQNTELDLANAKVIRLENKEYETQIQGKPYGVFEISYALFPTEEGVLEIPAQQVSVRMGRNSLFSARQGRAVTLRSKALQIPITALKNSNNVIVADDLVLSEKWPTNLQSVEVGNSLTREINLNIKGALAQTVPAIVMPEMAGLKIYPEAADKNEQKTANGVFIQRSRKFAIVPTQPGSVELPAIEYQWWNATEQKFQTARLPARTIKVTNAASDKTSTSLTGETQAKQEEVQVAPKEALREKIKLEKVYVENPVNYWLIASNIVSALVIAFLVLLLFWKRQKKADQALQTQPQEIDLEQQQFDLLLRACEQDSPAKIYQQLQRWSSCLKLDQWSQAGFKEQADYLQQSLFAQQSTPQSTQQSAQYSEQQTWSKEQFKVLLQAERKQWLADQKSDEKNKAVQHKFSLYPERVSG